MFSSNQSQVISEVPQGSLLGPVLFVFFIGKLLCVYEEKDLGLVILDKLTWDTHLHLIAAKAFSCLARSRLTNYEKRETALSVQQNSSSCASRCGTQSPPSHLLLWLLNSPRWLSYFLKKIYIFCLKLKRFFSISLVCCADSLD